MKTKIIVLIAGLLSFCCCTKENEKIILTSGISMDPSELRFGIELTNDSLFYCVETNPLSGQYNYFQATFESSRFNEIKIDVLKIYKYIDTKPKKDGQLFELITVFDGNKDSIRFNSEQFSIIEAIINTRETKKEKIEYHDFPKGLLEDKLPEPPPLIIPNNSM
jgi:hypothetical protein